MKLTTVVQLVFFAILAFAFGCTSVQMEEPLTMASGEGNNPFGGEVLTLSDFENGAGDLTIAPANYDFSYPEVAALPEYDVYLYELEGSPLTEIYAYDASMTPSSGTAGSSLEAACDRKLEIYNVDGYIAIFCRDTGNQCHVVEGTDPGTTIIVQCPKE